MALGDSDDPCHALHFPCGRAAVRAATEPTMIISNA